MELSDFYHIIRRRWPIVVAVTLICLAAVVGYTATIPTTYMATTRLYVSMATGTSVNDSYQGGLAAQERIASYSYLPEGTTVAQRVIRDLGLSISPAELQSKISVTFPPATTLLDISVTDSTPDGARMLADDVAAQFRRLVGEIETTVHGVAPAAQATVVEPAQTPTQASGPASKRFLAIGLLGGLALGFLAALARERLDRRVRTSEQLAEVLPVPVLGSVPSRELDASRAIARLRTRLTATRGGPNPATLMLTSFSGRSMPSVAIGLSRALADTGLRVALVDADVSGDGVAAYLGMQSDPGVADWLRTPRPTPRPPLAKLLQFSEDVGVVPLGAVDERTSDQLASERFAELMSHLEVRFDYILVDTAPIQTDAAALTLSSRCARTLALVELGKASLMQVHAAAASFGEFGSGLVGAVAVSSPSRRERRRQLRREPTPAARLKAWSPTPR